MESLILLIAAPSGAGKTTVCAGLLDAEPRLRRVVTCTTRPPRAGERDGVDYLFLSPEAFADRVERGEFLEHATVYGRSYGTLKSSVLEVLEGGHDVLLNIDVQGAASVRAAAAADARLRGTLVTAFLTPCGLAELEQRLRGRNADPEEVIQRRLAAARGEAARWGEFDYLVVSGTKEEDLERMRTLYAAERLRTSRQRFTLLD